MPTQSWRSCSFQFGPSELCSSGSHALWVFCRLACCKAAFEEFLFTVAILQTPQKRMTQRLKLDVIHAILDINLLISAIHTVTNNIYVPLHVLSS